MNPLEEARYKDAVLRFLQSKKHQFIHYREIARIDELKEISEATLTYLMEAIENDRYIRTDLTMDGRSAFIEDRADYFLEQGGYKAEFEALRKIEKEQENFKLEEFVKQQKKFELEIESLKETIKTSRWNRPVSIIALFISAIAIIVSVIALFH